MRTEHVARTVAACIAIAFFLSLSAEARAARQLELRKHGVVDRKGFKMAAMETLVPKDWTRRGSVEWNHRSFPSSATVSFSATDKRRHARFEVFPAGSFFWSDDPSQRRAAQANGAELLRPHDASSHVRSVFLPRLRSKASHLQVLETTPLPQVASQTQRQKEILMGILRRESGITVPTNLQVDAVRIKVSYREGGRDFIEDITAIVAIFTNSAPGAHGPVSVIAWESSIQSFRAPRDKMSELVPLFRLISNSTRANPAWVIAAVRLQAAQARETLRKQSAVLKEMRLIAARHASASSPSADDLMRSFRRQSASLDRVFEGYTEAVRGVDTYRDPVQETDIQLPTGYGNAWTDGDRYFFTDDPGWRPPGGSTADWQQLQRVSP